AIGIGSNAGDDEYAVNENDDDLDLTDAEFAEQEPQFLNYHLYQTSFFSRLVTTELSYCNAASTVAKNKNQPILLRNTGASITHRSVGDDNIAIRSLRSVDTVVESDTVDDEERGIPGVSRLSEWVKKGKVKDLIGYLKYKLSIKLGKKDTDIFKRWTEQGKDMDDLYKLWLRADKKPDVVYRIMGIQAAHPYKSLHLNKYVAYRNLYNNKHGIKLYRA
ncbi:hypothetical protein JG687_00018309, partial [Phytophthora cactorum]